MRKSPKKVPLHPEEEELKKALEMLARMLPYVIQAKDPEATDADGEWMTLWKVGEITGKDAAHKRLDELRPLAPARIQWRVLKKNEADVYEEGINVGRRLCNSTRRPPLRYLPENL